MQLFDISSQKEFSERQRDRYEVDLFREKHTPQTISEGESSPRVWLSDFIRVDNFIG